MFMGIFTVISICHCLLFVQSEMSLKYSPCNPHLRYQARTELVEIVDRFLVDYVDTGRFLEERPGHFAHGHISQEAIVFIKCSIIDISLNKTNMCLCELLQEVFFIFSLSLYF